MCSEHIFTSSAFDAALFYSVCTCLLDFAVFGVIVVLTCVKLLTVNVKLLLISLLTSESNLVHITTVLYYYITRDLRSFQIRFGRSDSIQKCGRACPLLVIVKWYADPFSQFATL